MRVLDPTQNRYVNESTLEYADAPHDTFPVRTPGGDWFALRPLTGETRAIGEDDRLLNVAIAAHVHIAEQIQHYVNEIPDNVPLLEGLDDPHILKAIFVIGSGGSGKSSIANEMFSGQGLKIINQDNHLERLIKAAKVPLDQVGSRYDLLKKSQSLKDVELRGYGNARLGVLIDSTGWDYPRVANPATKLRKLGYDVYLVYVTTSLETALGRNTERGEAGGRYVPDPYIRDAHYGAQQNFPKYKKLFGRRNTFVIDNDKKLTPDQFRKTLGPKLRKIGQTILSRPLENPKGKQWRETARQTLNDPKRPKDWQKPKQQHWKPAHVADAGKPKQAARRVVKPAPDITKDGVIGRLFKRAKANMPGSTYGKAKKRVSESLHSVNTTIEVAPPGFSGTVKAMQDKHGMPTDKAYKLAWAMYKKVPGRKRSPRKANRNTLHPKSVNDVKKRNSHDPST